MTLTGAGIASSEGLGLRSHELSGASGRQQTTAAMSGALFIMSWRTAIFVLVTVLVCYFCFAYTGLVIRGICFLGSLFLAIMAFAFFQHAVLFRNKWRAATTGKRRTPPGQSVIAGSVFLLLAIALMVYCFH